MAVITLPQTIGHSEDGDPAHVPLLVIMQYHDTHEIWRQDLSQSTVSCTQTTQSVTPNNADTALPSQGTMHTSSVVIQRKG
jgi:hypothetical protein